MDLPPLPEEARRTLTRFQVANLVDLRTLIRSRAARSTNPIQARVYAMAAAAIELGLLEHAGLRLEDTAGGTSWAEAREEGA